MNKRNLIRLGAGGLLAALATGAWSVIGAGQSDAAAPWSHAGKAEDPRLRALSFAVLAPSAHNLQPWLVELVGADGVRLYADPGLRLTEADPFDRQTVVGLGAFIELMAMAAAEEGFRADVALFPEGGEAGPLGTAPVARITLVADPATTPDPLFAQVLKRRSLKEPYDLNHPVADTSLALLKAAGAHGASIGASAATADVARLRDLTAQAMLVELESPAYEETVANYRFGRSEIEASPDGIAFGGLLFETLILFGQFTRQQALDHSSGVFAQGRDKILSSANTAMAHVWVVTPGNSRADQVAAGRDWVRINLAATSIGLGVHPLSQALEEFPQMAEHHRAAHALLAPEGGTVQMLARLGYAGTVDPTPRWPLAHKLVVA